MIYARTACRAVLSVSLFLSAVAAASAPAQASMDKALLLVAQGNVAGAVSTLEPMVAEGHAAAMTLLGDLLIKGRGIAADPARAMSLYKRAAIQGHGPAQLRYGSRLTQQSGKLSEGQSWLEKAASQQEPLAMRALGIIHRDVHDDPVEAARWFTRAQAHGDAAAKDLITDLQARQKARVAEAQARARGEPSPSEAKKTAKDKPKKTGIRKSYGTPNERRAADLTPAERADAIARGEIPDPTLKLDEDEGADDAAKDEAETNQTNAPDAPATVTPKTQVVALAPTGREDWPDWLQDMAGGGYPGVLHGKSPLTTKPDDLRGANGSPTLDALLSKLLASFGHRDTSVFAALTHARSQVCQTEETRVFYRNYLGDSLLVEAQLDNVTRKVTPIPAVPQLALDRTGGFFPVFPTHEVKVTYRNKKSSNIRIRLTLHVVDVPKYGWFLTPPCPSEKDAQWMWKNFDMQTYQLPRPISRKAQQLRHALSAFEEETAKKLIRADKPFQAFVNIRAADYRIGDDLAWEILNLIEMEIGKRAMGSIPKA